MRSQRFGTLIDPLAIDRLGAIKRLSHARVLRALARKHEHNRRRALRGLCFDCAFDEPGLSLVETVGDNDGAVREGTATCLQRRGHVGERDTGVGDQMFGEISLSAFERCRAPCRERQNLQRVLWLFLRLACGVDTVGRFFQHHVHIRTADAEGTHAGATRRRAGSPCIRANVKEERAVSEVDAWIG